MRYDTPFLNTIKFGLAQELRRTPFKIIKTESIPMVVGLVPRWIGSYVSVMDQMLILAHNDDLAGFDQRSQRANGQFTQGANASIKSVNQTALGLDVKQQASA